MSEPLDTRPPGRSAAGVPFPLVARVRVAVAPLLGEPRAAATQTSQYLNGAQLAVLETRGEWFRVRGPDVYEGWIHRGYVIDTETAASE